MQKRKLNIKKITIFILVIVGLILSSILVRNLLKPKETNKETKVISEIKGYELKENSSSYYKNIFNDLKVELSKDEIDFDKYATIITQLFISDCFTLDNKINHNDVGGVQFIYEPFRDDFILIATETIYSHVENNIYGNRKQELPIVSNVTITSVKNNKYEYLDTIDDNAYFIEVAVEYTKDLGYPKEASLVIINNNEKLEIAEME
ncbi:MAG: hypothetical protein PHW32_01375 [Bacilli bacterium]|nr:hypothetical protein [Bacilli bacterium]MDD4282339.1 hypothetical protein [Bacilli bacterium]